MVSRAIVRQCIGVHGNQQRDAMTSSAMTSSARASGAIVRQCDGVCTACARRVHGVCTRPHGHTATRRRGDAALPSYHPLQVTAKCPGNLKTRALNDVLSECTQVS